VHWRAASFLLIAVCVASLALAVVAWRRRRQAGAAPGLALLMAAAAAWALPAAIEMGATSSSLRLDAERVCFFGMATVPLACLAYAYGLVKGAPLIGRRPTFLLAVPGLVAAGVAWDPHLKTAETTGGWKSPIHSLSLGTIRNPLISALIVYAAALVAVSLATLLPRMIRSRAPYRWQYGAALLAVAGPSLAEGVLGLSAGGAVAIRWTPVVFLAVDGCTVWALCRHRLLDLNPIDRERLIDALRDPLVVVDAAGRVADVNPPAQLLLMRVAPTTAHRIGSHLPEPLATWVEQAALGGGKLIADASTEHELLYLDISVTQSTQPGQPHKLTVVVLRDVTTDYQAERKLESANRQLVEHLGEIQRLRKELERQVVVDPLTGLYNRRYLSTVLPREAKMAKRSGQPLSVALIDADHFKRVNDELGHAVGDQVLAELTGLLRRAVRATDHAVRYGGEEILIIMPNATANDAARRCDAWRRAISEHFGRHPALPPITVSIGVATMPYHGTDIQRVLAAADLALYSAKSAGRNRVVVADAVMSELLRSQGTPPQAPPVGRRAGG
jgi:diguanylate cyclase (GGDEF)-like protein